MTDAVVAAVGRDFGRGGVGRWPKLSAAVLLRLVVGPRGGCRSRPPTPRFTHDGEVRAAVAGTALGGEAPFLPGRALRPPARDW